MRARRQMLGERKSLDLRLHQHRLHRHQLPLCPLQENLRRAGSFRYQRGVNLERLRIVISLQDTLNLMYILSILMATAGSLLLMFDANSRALRNRPRQLWSIIYRVKWMSALHQSRTLGKPTLDESGDTTKSCCSFSIKYREFNAEMLQELVSHSLNCSQYIKYDCFMAPLELHSTTWFISSANQTVDFIGDVKRYFAPAFQ